MLYGLLACVLLMLAGVRLTLTDPNRLAAGLGFACFIVGFLGLINSLVAMHRIGALP